MKPDWNEEAIFVLVRESVMRELPPGSPTPETNVDLLKSGLLDSMGWVGVLSALEKALGVRNFADTWPEGKPQSIEALVQLARDTRVKSESTLVPSVDQKPSKTSRIVSIVGWGSALGSSKIDAAHIESQYGMPAGTLSERAGIRSVCWASGTEDEISLGQAAANRAVENADLDPSELDLLVCTSATFLELPSFSAALHNRLLLSESCAALDVGGACVGLLNALATAKSFLANGDRRAALVVASEVHSRRFATSKEAGEFRGLFGDAACAFALRSSDELQSDGDEFRIGEFVSGCSGALSSALRLSLQPDGAVGVTFNGEALAKSAVTTLNEVFGKLESLSGAARSEVEYFALHEPNPRLAAILAQRANVPIEKLVLTAESTGNLGSATCGVNLCNALTRAHQGIQSNGRRLIFVAAVGPGILWSGTYVEIGDRVNQPQ